MSLVVAINELYNDQELLAKAEYWERVELDYVVKIMNGFPLKSAGFTSKPDGFPVIRIRDLKYNSVQTYYTLDFPEEFIVGDSDLLIGMDGDFIGYEWSAGKAVLNQRVCKLIPDERYLLKRFLFYGINGYLKAIWDATSAVTVKHLSSLDIAKIPFPLPPLAEQARIVAALNGLIYSDLKDERKRVWIQTAQSIETVESLRRAYNLDPTTTKSIQLKAEFEKLRKQIAPCTELSSTIRCCLRSSGLNWALKMLEQPINVKAYCKDYLPQVRQSEK